MCTCVIASMIYPFWKAIISRTIEKKKYMILQESRLKEKKEKKICARYMFDMKRRIVSSNVVEQWIRSRLRCIAKISRQNSEKFWHYDTRNRSTIFQIITTERIDNRCSKIRIDNHYIFSKGRATKFYWKLVISGS